MRIEKFEMEKKNKSNLGYTEGRKNTFLFQFMYKSSVSFTPQATGALCGRGDLHHVCVYLMHNFAKGFL